MKDPAAGHPVTHRGARFRWPDWRCEAIDDGSASVCRAPATHQARATARADRPWLYCARHAPAGAERIADDAPFYVTRVELRVALTGAPGNRAQATDEALRRLAYALEDVGAALVELRVVGQKAPQDRPSRPRMRLELAGRGEDSKRGEKPLWGELDAPASPFERRRRRTG